MSKTINGKEISVILEELQADFPKEEIQNRDYDNMPYISVDSLQTRLNNVLGVMHYNEKYTEVVVEKVKDTYGVSTIGTIEILDDDFEPIIIKQAPGSSTITFPNIDKKDENGKVITDEDGKAIKVQSSTTNSYANDKMSACQDAFKRICKKLGIGAKQLQRKSGKDTYFIKFCSNVSYGTKGLFTDIIVDNKSTRLAIFTKQFDIAKSKFPNGFVKDQIVAIYGKEGKDNRGNDQIIFEKFSKETIPSTTTSQPQNTISNTKSTQSQQNTNTQSNSTQQASNSQPATTTQQSTESKDNGAEQTTTAIQVDTKTIYKMHCFSESEILQLAQSGDYAMKVKEKSSKMTYLVVIPKTIVNTYAEWKSFNEKVDNSVKQNKPLIFSIDFKRTGKTQNGAEKLSLVKINS